MPEFGPATRMRLVGRIHCNDLPLSARERFVQAARNRDPSLIRSATEDTPVIIGLFAVFFAIALIGLVVTYANSRDWTNSIPREMYGLMIPEIAVVLALMLAFLTRQIWPPPPYAPGNYLFANYVVSTDGDALHMMAFLVHVSW